MSKVRVRARVPGGEEQNEEVQNTESKAPEEGTKSGGKQKKLAPTNKNLEVRYVRIDDLKPAAYNPRKLPLPAKKQIIRSIERFGVVDPLIVNQHPDRLNVIVGGHQRYKVLKELGYKEVPVVFVNLPEPEEKELNLRLNRNHGEWDFEALRDSFSFDFLEGVGFTPKELGETQSAYEKQLEAITNDKAETPIVPQFSEKYELLCVFIRNEIDLNYFKNVLGLHMHKSYKNQTSGDTYVITAEKLQACIDKQVEIAKLSAGAQAEAPAPRKRSRK